MGEDSTGQPGADRTDDRAETERPTVHVRRRLTVSEAAEELAISAEAVRSRVKRGTLRSVKEGGTVYVLLPTAQSRPGDDQTTPEHDRAGAQAELVESLLDQVKYMREQLAAEREANRENRRLLAAALERIPAIESSETPGGPQTAAESPEGTTDTPADVAGAQEATERRSWWRRWFGG
jgi:hypothetical protein